MTTANAMISAPATRLNSIWLELRNRATWVAAAPVATNTTVKPATNSAVTRSIRCRDASPACRSATEYPDMSPR